MWEAFSIPATERRHALMLHDLGLSRAIFRGRAMAGIRAMVLPIMWEASFLKLMTAVIQHTTSQHQENAIMLVQAHGPSL